MKNNLEKSIKESLKGYEAPYNAAAWTAMSAKLDAKMPTGSTGGSSFKWIAAGAAVLVVAGASYFALKGETNVVENSVKISQNEENVFIKDTNTDSSVKETVTEIENQTEVEADNLNNSETSQTIVGQDSQSNGNNNTDVNNSDVVIADAKPSSNDNVITNPEKTDNPKSDKPEASIRIPSVEDHCAGKIITLTNSNSSEMTIEGPNYTYTIEAGASAVLSFTNSGSYRMTVDNTTKSFNVKSLPNVNFVIDTDNKFDKGLPTTQLTGTSGSNLVWSFNQGNVSGSEVDAHFFKKGNHSIKLTATGTNGCSNSISKDHYVSADYNLMAVNAFIPGHHDPQRNTFMPYALSERDVKFSLIIIDPTDGRTVFQTNDSSNGWDGIDKKTGMQVKKETVYIWKVIIENPERGESNEYAGNIIPISK